VRDAALGRLNDQSRAEGSSGPQHPEEAEDPASALWRAVEALAAEQRSDDL
jgi:hypothetical protein